MICDYYIVRRGYLDIKAIYSASKSDPYYYTYGFSWRAYASYLAGILINIVGFAGAVGKDVPMGAQYIYNLNYFTGVLVSGGMYWLLTKLFPVPATSGVWNEVDIDIDEYTVSYGQEVGDEENTYGERRSITDSLPPDDQKGLSSAAKKV